jgi:glycosyltransferase involved in cell wall biosynthesis
LKIGIFTDSYLPTPTGIAVSVETFRKGLEHLGHDVYIFAPEFPRYVDHNPRVMRFPSFFTPARSDAPIALPILNKHWQEIEKIGLDIIHTQHFFTLGSFGLQAGKKLHIPVVHTYHTLYVEYTNTYAPFLRGFARWWLIRKSRIYANQCQTIIAPSPSMKKLIRQYGIVTPIEAIPTGIDPDAFTSMTPESLRHKFSIPADRHVLLFVGRLGDEKNIRFLLRAFKIIWQRREKTHLLFIGGGPQEEEYKKIVANQPFHDHITFAGFLPKGETNKIFGACDLFVFPSITDAQGIVVVEAFAAGIPVVAVNRLGPSDIVRDNEDGFLTPLNEQAFADKVIYLLENEKMRRHFGQAARNNALRFSSANSTRHLVEVYQRLIS